MRRSTLTRSFILAQLPGVSYLLRKGLIVGAALFVFVLALELLKTGAAAVAVVLQGFNARGMLNTLGFGWLMAYLVLSGSPVAAASLGLFGSGALTPLETFAMINGSRFGASFVVLFTGFVYYLRGIRGRGVVSIGVLAMITTATIYLPAMVLGSIALTQGWLVELRPHVPAVLASGIDLLYDPITELAERHLPRLMNFAIGFLALLASFRLFDLALPSIDSIAVQQRWGGWMRDPRRMFLIGLLVTSITLSVSASLGVLVPLAGRGYVKREHVIPYIMGANISTFVDTLFAALLLRAPLAATIVLTEMAAVAVVSGAVLIFLFGPYERRLLALNAWITGTKKRFAVFVAILALLPAILLFV